MLDQVNPILNGGGKGMACVGRRWHNHRAVDAVNGHTDGVVISGDWESTRNVDTRLTALHCARCRS